MWDQEGIANNSSNITQIRNLGNIPRSGEELSSDLQTQNGWRNVFMPLVKSMTRHWTMQWFSDFFHLIRQKQHSNISLFLFFNSLVVILPEMEKLVLKLFILLEYKHGSYQLLSLQLHVFLFSMPHYSKLITLIIELLSWTILFLIILNDTVNISFINGWAIKTKEKTMFIWL